MDERLVFIVNGQRGLLVNEDEIPKVVGTLSATTEFEQVGFPLLLDFAYELIDSIRITEDTDD